MAGIGGDSAEDREDILESSLEEELLMEFGASRYKRTSSRRNYRNGHYERSFATKYGVIKALRVPWARESYQSQILPRYQRRQEQVQKMIRKPLHQFTQ